MSMVELLIQTQLMAEFEFINLRKTSDITSRLIEQHHYYSKATGLVNNYEV
jgi:hypothetical protein